MSGELAHYRGLLTDIKTRVRQAQHKAALSANAEMIRLYWDIGRLIAARQEQEGWGAGVIPRLAADLKNELPEEKGFSERNIGHMIRFAREYGAPPILQRAAAKSVPQAAAQIGTRVVAQIGAPAVPQSSDHPEAASILQQPAAKLPIPVEMLLGIPWFHHVLLIQKVKHLPTAGEEGGAT